MAGLPLAVAVSVLLWGAILEVLAAWVFQGLDTLPLFVVICFIALLALVYAGPATAGGVVEGDTIDLGTRGSGCTASTPSSWTRRARNGARESWPDVLPGAALEFSFPACRSRSRDAAVTNALKRPAATI